jgi:hypothetical protein
MTESDVVRALGALAQQSRLQIFRALVVAGEGGLTPGRLRTPGSLPKSAMAAT